MEHDAEAVVEDIDVTMPLWTANILGAIFFVGSMGCLDLVFLRMHDASTVSSLFLSPYWPLIFGVGIVLHEGLHVVGFMAFGHVTWSQIQIGFAWRAMTPFAHCKVPVRAWRYRLAGVLPGVLLGVVPLVVGLLTGTAWLAGWGGLFFAAAFGDFLALWLLRNIEGQAMVVDHPHDLGCRVIGSHVDLTGASPHDLGTP